MQTKTKKDAQGARARDTLKKMSRDKKPVAAKPGLEIITLDLDNSAVAKNHPIKKKKGRKMPNVKKQKDVSWDGKTERRVSAQPGPKPAPGPGPKKEKGVDVPGPGPTVSGEARRVVHPWERRDKPNSV